MTRGRPPGAPLLFCPTSSLPASVCFLNDQGETVTAQPLGNILESQTAAPGQKTRILGRWSKNCSHLYSRLQPSAVTLVTSTQPNCMTSCHACITVVSRSEIFAQVCFHYCDRCHRLPEMSC